MDNPSNNSEPAETPSFSLTEAFRTKSVQLEAVMKSVAPFTDHGPTVGDASEVGWRAMLTEFLPTRYAVTKAFVVDSRGATSQQIDIVVHDRHFTPLFWRLGDQYFLPAESVYAVFEVKQDLSAAHVTAAAAKIASVRALHRTSHTVVHVEGKQSNPKPPLRILGGLLTGRSSWAEPFGKPFQSALQNLSEPQRIDIGCALQHGSFELRDPNVPDLTVSQSPDVGLATFAMRLMAKLQDLGTVPAISIDAYTREIERPA